jgi:predicted GIY-YIG superfamily endonuclease
MYTIYALIDPRDYTVHYIGQTSDVYKRFNQHISGNGGSLVKAAWIFELRALNKMVIMETLEEVETHDQAIEREAYWIRYFEALEEPIVNISHRGPLKRLRDEQLAVAQSAMSHGLAAFRIRRTVKAASPVIGSNEDIVTLFFEKQLNFHAILRRKWPHIRGGDAYQTRSKEINNAVRAYVEAAQEADGSTLVDSPLTETETKIVYMFVSQKLNASAIIRVLWPHVNGGSMYQEKSLEVNETIRKYTQMQKRA